MISFFEMWILCGLLVLVTISANNAGADYQTVDPEGCESGVDLVFLVDISSSVADSDFQTTVDFILSLLQVMDIAFDKTRIALATFSSDVLIHLHFKDTPQAYFYIAHVLPTMDRNTGSTNTADALARMRTDIFQIKSGDRPEAVNIAVVITDGVSNLNSERTVTEALKSKALGIYIFALGIGLTGRTPELQLICSQPHEENLFVFDSFTQVPSVRDDIARKICQVGDHFQYNNTNNNEIQEDNEYCEYPFDLAILVRSNDNSSILNDYLRWYIGQMDRDLARVAIVVEENDGSTRWSSFKHAKWSVTDLFTFGKETQNGLGVLNRKVFDITVGNRELIPDILLVINNKPVSKDLRRITRKLKSHGTYIITLSVGENSASTVKKLRRLSSESLLMRPVHNVSALYRVHEEVSRIVCNVARIELLKITQGEGIPFTQLPTSQTSPTTEASEFGVEPEELPAIEPETVITECNAHGDIIFVIDSSGSVGQEGFIKAVDAVKNVGTQLLAASQAVRVGVVTFSDTAVYHIRPEQHIGVHEFRRTCHRIQYVYGSTNMASALSAIYDNYMAANTSISAQTQPLTTTEITAHTTLTNPTLVVIITDGLSNKQREETIPIARRLVEDANVFLLALAVRLHQIYELEQIVSKPRDTFLRHTESYDTLPESLDVLREQLCQGTSLCEASPCLNNGSCSSTIGSVKCHCPMGYTGPRCQYECRTPADVVFAAESSNRLTMEHFTTMREFIRGVVTVIDVTTCPIRFGVMKYGTEAIVQIQLDMATTNAELHNALDDVHYSHGENHPHIALQRARKEMFLPLRRNHTNVRSILVLLTEGLPSQRSAFYAEMQLTRRANISLIPVSIGVTDSPDFTQVVDENYILRAENIALLPNVTQDLTNILLKDPQPCTPMYCYNGGTCFKLGITKMCHCPLEVFGTRCQTRCFPDANIIFGVDASAFMSVAKLNKARQLFTVILQAVLHLHSNTHIGIVSLSRRVRVEMPRTSSPVEAVALEKFADIKPWYYTEIDDSFHVKIQDAFDARLSDEHNFLVLLISSEQSQQLDLRSLAALGMDTIVAEVGTGSKFVYRYLPRLPFTTPVYEENEQQMDSQAFTRKVISHLCEDEDQCWHEPCQHSGHCEDGTHAYSCTCPDQYLGTHCQLECSTQTDLALLLDSSGSVGRQHFQQLKTWLAELARFINAGHNRNIRLSVVTFSSYPSIEFFLNDYNSMEAVLQAIEEIEYRYGDSNIADAMYMVREHIFTERNGHREGSRKVIVVVADGASNIYVERAQSEAHALKEAGAVIYSVAVGHFDSSELLDLSGRPQLLTFVDNFETLDSVNNKLYNFFCANAEMNRCLSNPCQHGGQCLDDVMGDVTCLCGDGIAGSRCQIACPRAVDLLFLLDSSTSLGLDNFRKALQFLANLTLQLPFQATRYAIVTFSETSKVQLRFHTGLQQRALVDFIQSIRYTDGATNTASALRAASSEIFRVQNGDRPNAQNVVLLITDGESNINPEQTLPEAHVLHGMQVEVLVIAVQLENLDEVKSIASDGYMRAINSYNELWALQDDILFDLCT